MNCTLISNPPYNMKWIVPPFAQIQPRFYNCEVPPKSNANYAFVLTALEKSDRCVFILPCGVLSTDTKQEKAIRKYLVDKNLIESIILCPDKMFEATNIPTCIIVFNKNKTDTYVRMIDMRQTYETEQRMQNGQWGGASKENRTYTKNVKVFTDEQMQKAIDCIENKTDVNEFSKLVTIQDVVEQDYLLTPSRYIEFQEKETTHREYCEIIKDINRIVREKNACKLTINETLAKSLGFDLNLYKAEHQNNKELDELLINLKADKLLKHDYFTATKNKNEIKFENKDKDQLSSILIMVMQTWKQHIYYLNQEENRYLAELREAFLPDLLSGKIELN